MQATRGLSILKRDLNKIILTQSQLDKTSRNWKNSLFEETCLLELQDEGDSGSLGRMEGFLLKYSPE